MAPPRPLMDDVTAEILLRLPPDEPEHLFRAALVCKPWLRIICDPGFSRCYREFHGAPPLLGLLHRRMVIQGDPPARFASTTSMPEFPTLAPTAAARAPSTAATAASSSTCCLVSSSGTPSRATDTTCHPSRRKWIGSSTPPRCSAPPTAATAWTATAAPSASSSRPPMRMTTSYSRACTHQETGEWSLPVCLDNTCEIYAQHIREARADGPFGRFYTPYLQPRRGALVGDAVYFTVRWGNAVVKYDLGKNRLSMIDPPEPRVWDIAITALENNTSLGFACIQGSSLYTWSRRVDTEDEAAEWVQYRVLELDKKIPVANSDEKLCVVGFAEGVDVIFVSSGVGLFMIKLSSGQVKKVDEPGEYFSVLPYMSFYLPEISNGGGHDATDLPHST